MPVSLRDLGAWAVIVLLVGVLLFNIVHAIRDGALSSCPAYDGITDRAAALTVCPDGHR